MCRFILLMYTGQMQVNMLMSYTGQMQVNMLMLYTGQMQVNMFSKEAKLGDTLLNYRETIQPRRETVPY